MKTQLIHIKLLLAAFLLSLSLSSYSQYETYFTDNQLRIDYFIFGNSDTAIYAVDKLIKEPYWGGSKTHLIDSTGYGNYYFEVLLNDSDIVIYSHGYCNLFGEWQTTEEAQKIIKGFSESIIFPFPKEIIDVVFYNRTWEGNYVEKMRVTVDPKDYFIQKAKKLPYSIYEVCGDRNSDKAVDIVILPDGYTNDEMGKFVKDCEFFAKSLFDYEPYTTYKDRFNIHAVMAPSLDSGITIPAENLWKNTVLNCSFYTFDSERYCMTYDNQSIRNLAGQVPYDQIYILANTEKYGGGGIYNFYCVSASANLFSSAVIIHEFGHGFAGLADEYYDDTTTYGEFYNLDIEPWEPNLTTLKDFDGKWQNQLKKKTPVPTPAEERYIDEVGVFEGGGYEAKGMYRPKMDCLMHTFRGNTFCEVCRKAIEKMILLYSE